MVSALESPQLPRKPDNKKTNEYYIVCCGAQRKEVFHRLWKQKLKLEPCSESYLTVQWERFALVSA